MKRFLEEGSADGETESVLLSAKEERSGGESLFNKERGIKFFSER